MKKRILSILLALVLCLSLLPTTALAAGNDLLSSLDVTHTTDASGNVTAITARVRLCYGKASANAQLMLMTKRLSGKENATADWGDFSDYGSYYSNHTFTTFDGVLADSTLGIKAHSSTVSLSASSDTAVTLDLNSNKISLGTNATYYVYLWTKYNGYVYPDTLICAIQVKDGALQFATATDYRNSFDESGFTNAVIAGDNKYSVTVTKGDHMTRDTSGGAESQSDLTTAMTPVVYTAESGYYFPEDYSVTTVNGIMVRRDSESQITVYGTPSANAEITLDAASVKPAEGTLTFNYAYDAQRAPTWPQVGAQVTLSTIQAPFQANGSDRYSTSEGTWTLTPVGKYTNYEGKSTNTTNDTWLGTIADNVATEYGVSDKNDVPIYALKLDGALVVYGVVQAQGKVYDQASGGTEKDSNGVLFLGATNNQSHNGGTGYFLTSEGGLTSSDTRYMLVGKDASGAETVTVTFDKNCTDANVTAPGATYVKKNCSPTNAQLPTLIRTGYTFGGWYTSSKDFSDENKVTTSSTFDKDITLYAKWTANHSHNWESAWQRNDTHHWHNCSASGCNVTENSGKDGYGAHSYTETVADAAYLADSATCTAKATYYKSCVCGAVSTNEADVFTSGTANGHTPGSEWKYDGTNHWHICTVTSCGAVIDSTKTAHTAGDWEVKTPATAANNGVKVKKCTACGYEMETAMIPKIVASKPLYDVIVKDAPNGEADSNRDEARPGTIVTITVAPDSGYTLDDITVTDKDGNELEVNDLGGGKYSFIMPDSDVTVRPGFTDGSGTGFVDVPADKYYYDAVNWAVANGITGGIDGTHFAPNAPCTRGQMVTLLWRALGKPEAKTASNPFTDVKEGSAFYQAILWASENDIVVGYADGTFRPNNPVTRQQSAAILWRYAKYAGMDVSVGEDTNILSFDDALDIAEYAFPALQWAVGEGIMQGSHGNLLPRSTCTRAQIVTMLYRLLTE